MIGRARAGGRGAHRRAPPTMVRARQGGRERGWPRRGRDRRAPRHSCCRGPVCAERCAVADRRRRQLLHRPRPQGSQHRRRAASLRPALYTAPRIPSAVSRRRLPCAAARAGPAAWPRLHPRPQPRPRPGAPGLPADPSGVVAGGAGTLAEKRGGGAGCVPSKSARSCQPRPGRETERMCVADGGGPGFRRPHPAGGTPCPFPPPPPAPRISRPGAAGLALASRSAAGEPWAVLWGGCTFGDRGQGSGGASVLAQENCLDVCFSSNVGDK